jgi:hypothetical protein
MQGEHRTCIITFSDAREAIQARQELQHYQLDDWSMPIVINFAKASIVRHQNRHKSSHDYRLSTPPPTNPYMHMSPPYRPSYYMSPPPYQHHYYGYGYPTPGFSYGYGYPIDHEIARRESTPPPQRHYYHSGYYFDPEPSPPLQPSMAHIQGYPYEERDKLGNRACATLFVTNFEPQTTEEDVRCMFPTAERVMLGTKALKEGEYRTGYISFDSVQTAVMERNRVMRMQSEEGNRERIHELNIHFSKRPQDQVYAAVLPPSPPPMYHTVQHDPYAEYYYDHRGNPATNLLFVDCLPPTANEESVFRLFERYGPSAVKLGKKTLKENEFRTCIIHFPTVDQAIQARVKLNGISFDKEWRKPMVINFRSPQKSSLRNSKKE